VLDGLLYHQSEVAARRHHTDGGGDSDHVFAFYSVGLAINLATLDDERPPDAPNKADRRLGRQRSLPRSVKRPEHVERVDDRPCRRCRLERERFQEGRRDLARTVA
jgi:hypothetical protein